MSTGGEQPPPHHQSDFNLPSPIAEAGESTAASPAPHPPPFPLSQLSPLLFGVGGRRGSAPDSRRGSTNSISGSGTGVFGGLPPPEPQINPRRGSATGSYGLPVPPEWLRAQAAENRRGSRAQTQQDRVVCTGSLLGLSGSGRDSPTSAWPLNPTPGSKKLTTPGEEKRVSKPRPLQLVSGDRDRERDRGGQQFQQQPSAPPQPQQPQPQQGSNGFHMFGHMVRKKSQGVRGFINFTGLSGRMTDCIS